MQHASGNRCNPMPHKSKKSIGACCVQNHEWSVTITFRTLDGLRNEPAKTNCMAFYFCTGGRGKTQYILSLGAALYFRGSVNWRLWNGMRDAKPTPEFLLLDDCELVGDYTNIKTQNLLKAIMQGAAFFDLCSPNGAYSFHLRHGLPTVALTNESYFQHHMDFVQLHEKLWRGGDASAEAM